MVDDRTVTAFLGFIVCDPRLPHKNSPQNISDKSFLRMKCVTPSFKSMIFVVNLPRLIVNHQPYHFLLVAADQIHRGKISKVFCYFFRISAEGHSRGFR